jgi:hypothetical protein
MTGHGFVLVKAVDLIERLVERGHTHSYMDSSWHNIGLYVWAN